MEPTSSIETMESMESMESVELFVELLTKHKAMLRKRDLKQRVVMGLLTKVAERKRKQLDEAKQQRQELETKLAKQDDNAVQLTTKLATSQQTLKRLCAKLTSLAVISTPELCTLSLNVTFEDRFLGCHVLALPDTTSRSVDKAQANLYMAQLQAWVAGKVSELPGMCDHPVANDDMRICLKQQNADRPDGLCSSLSVLTSAALSSLFYTTSTVNLDVSKGTFFEGLSTAYEAAVASQPKGPTDKTLGTYFDWAAKAKHAAMLYVSTGLCTLGARWSRLALAWRTKLFDRMFQVHVGIKYNAWFEYPTHAISAICQAALDVMDFVADHTGPAQDTANHLLSALQMSDFLRGHKAELKSSTLLKLVGKFCQDNIVMMRLNPLVYNLQLVGSGEELADIMKYCMTHRSYTSDTSRCLSETTRFLQCLASSVLEQQHCSTKVRDDFCATAKERGCVRQLKEVLKALYTTVGLHTLERTLQAQASLQ